MSSFRLPDFCAHCLGRGRFFFRRLCVPPRCFGLRLRRRLRLPRHCLRPHPREFWVVLQEMGVDFAMALDFCAVFDGGCSLSAPSTWGNAGVLWQFGLIRPAKPPRSCKRGFACVGGGAPNMCFGFVGAGRRRCDCLSSKIRLADCGGRHVGAPLPIGAIRHLLD